MKRVLKETVPGGKSIVLAPQDGPVRQDQGLEKLEIVLADAVGNVDGSAGDGTRGGVKDGAGMSRLEHVPVWVDEVPHP